jgi:hypothetical protein
MGLFDWLFKSPKAKKQFAKLPAVSKEQTTALNKLLSRFEKPLSEAQKGFERFEPGARAAERGLERFRPDVGKEAGSLAAESAEGYRQFLPGGGGGQAIAQAAQNRFQQQTLPSILNAFGSGAKTSSALNQALAAGAANLNTDVAAELARMQLGAAQGMGSLSGQQGALGLGRSGQQLSALQASGQLGLGRSAQELAVSQALAQLGLGEASTGLGVSPFGYQQRSNPFYQDLLLGGISGGSQVLGGWLGRG